MCVHIGRARATSEIQGETTMLATVKSGTALAAAAAALVLAGVGATPSSYAATGGVGHCMGANACKGHGACKSASNACKGQNACKGKGFVEMTKAECDKIEGASFDPLQEAVKPKG
jgi:hypothetical protein